MVEKRVGAYEILKPLKVTSSARSYAAQHGYLKHKAIVTLFTGHKIDARYKDGCSGDLPAIIKQARYEASLEHPNIAKTYAVDITADGYIYVATASYKGESLEQRLRRQEKLTWQQAFDIAKQLFTALDYAHQHTIVHDNVKPSTVFITRKGLVKLLELGQSHLNLGAQHSTPTLWGSIAYMSPQKLLRAQRHSNDDIWSWAVIFYELLTRRQPFVHKDLGHLMQAIINDEPYALGQALEAKKPSATTATASTATETSDNHPPLALSQLITEILDAKGKGYVSSEIFNRLQQIGRKEQENSVSQPLAPHNLDAVLRPLWGCEDALQEIRRLLEQQHFLITLVAMGGTGKSHVLRHVAYERLIERNFKAGVYYLDLAAMRQSSEVAHALIALWRDDDAAIVSDAQPWRQVIHLFDDRCGEKGVCLLVLDNCEHLAITNELEFLLQATSSLFLLLGSRHTLGMEQEYSYRLPPLALPVDGSSLLDNPCYQLFVEGAGNHLHADRLAATEREAIVAISNFFAGLALGIFWAAAWSEELQPTQILDRLEHDDAFLKQPRAIPARYPSPWASCEASWQQLGAIEQHALSRLAIFPHTFSYTAASQVAAVTILMLKKLVTKSLVRFDAASERYHLHPLWQRFLSQCSVLSATETTDIAKKHSYFYGYCLEKMSSYSLEHYHQFVKLEQANIHQAQQWLRANNHALTPEERATLQRLNDFSQL